MEEKEKQERLAIEKEKLEMEDRVQLKEIEAKVQMEKEKLEKNKAHQALHHIQDFNATR